ncbi:NAD(P)/FAD-dependent oxidoreductase [Spirochaetia bacterium 38H-sp]|uniref:NADH:ubiquinone reductase (non-electrogenic) n=1 Tax=Rarispira pelagica TaxID=3141764 RepID=A0ABU9U8C4_9SPIR
MSDITRIVIIGGGYAGINAAKVLEKRLKRREDVEIILIDKNHYHTLMTDLHEVAGGRIEPDGVRVSFARIFSGKRTRWICDRVDGVDFDSSVVIGRNDRYSYDYLIVAAGGAPEFFNIPGVQENSFTLWSWEDAVRIRSHMEDCFDRAAATQNERLRKRLLTFVIAGGGFTGVELAGEFVEHRDVLCKKYHIPKEEVDIIVVEALDRILPNFTDRLAAKAHKRLIKKGARVLTGTRITGAEKKRVLLGDDFIETETFIWTAGVHGGELSAKLDLSLGQAARGECSVVVGDGIHGMAACYIDEEERDMVGTRGRFLVNKYMQSFEHNNVYVVGDISWYVEGEKVLPQVVETAIQTSHVAAANIAADILQKDKEAFKSNYHGFMVSVGSRYAVADVMGVKISGFFAMALKHLVNLHYLWGLAGFNAVWGYIKEEFLNIKDSRSIVHGHFAWKIPVYWALPLRLFLGAKWLIEGINKVVEGWLNPGSGGIFSPDASAIHLPGVVLKDAVSAASEQVDAAAEAVSQSLMPALGIYTWFADNVLSQFPALAFIAQALVVLAEILIGLAFVGGLFVFPAAVASIGLAVMFIISGWGSPELLWYIAAAIVMMGGAGRGFGLDHYVMPFIKKFWNRRKIAKKTYLYIDEPED